MAAQSAMENAKRKQRATGVRMTHACTLNTGRACTTPRLKVTQPAMQQLLLDDQKLAVTKPRCPRELAHAAIPHNSRSRVIERTPSVRIKFSINKASLGDRDVVVGIK